METAGLPPSTVPMWVSGGDGYAFVEVLRFG